MKHLFRIQLTALLLTAGMCAGLRAQSGSVLISEFATRGGAVGNAAGEFIELYNPGTANVDVSGWKLGYRSATGSSYSDIATFPAGTVIKARSYFLLTGATWGGTVAADLKWTGSGLADNGNIRVTNAASVEIDRVGFGTGNDPKGSPAPNHGDVANDNSVERKASAGSTSASMCPGGADEFAGNMYNSGNNANDFVVRSCGRDPQNSASAPEPRTDDGSGAAYSKLRNMKSGESANVPIVYVRDPARSVTDIRIAIPAGFLWSRTPSDVTTDGQAAVTVSEDTVFITGITYVGDSITVTVKSVSAPSTTSAYVFTVSSRGAGGTYLPVQQQPSVLVSGAPIPIADARQNDAAGVAVRLNQFVTVNGIVTVSNQFGAPSYMQDATGGVAVYDFPFADSVQVGDEVTITGKVTQYNGLTELTDVVIEARGVAGGAVVPEVVTVAQVLADGKNGLEEYESMLVRINSVTVNTSAWTVTGSGTNYQITDATGTMDVRVDNSVDFANKPAPGGSFDLVGVMSQFQKNSPFAGGYQLMPRMAKDIVAGGPGIIELPLESDIQPHAMKISWRTAKSAAAFARYGTTSAYELGIATGSAAGTEQSVNLSSLTPGTIYLVQPFSVASGDTSFAQPYYVSSASLTSTGAVNAYFNKTVETSLLPSFPAKGSQDLKNKLLDRIDAAKYSIDMAVYSLSGGVGDDIAAALLSAKGRGVKIRMIVEADNANTSSIRTLRSAVPVILDTFDPLNAGAGLMHNKFTVIDARDRSSDTDDWVLTGSWNATDPGTYDDAQNLVEIQDQALAVTYTKEFEEMWGSSTETPSSGVSRFGARKRPDTPRHFNVAGVPMEVHFSPSDRTTEFLVKSARAAKTSIYFAILTFTRDDLATAMIDQRQAGRSVRGVMDNNTDQGSQYASLKSGGVDVFLKKNIAGLLHHKYMVVDAENAQNGMVVTGSHNWSNAAENANNENTIGISNSAIARQYVQEWYRRYLDAGGTGTVVLGIERMPSASPSFTLDAPWPNPAVRGSDARVSFNAARTAPLRIALVDALGREAAVIADGMWEAGSWRLTFETSALSAGVYRVVLTQDGRAVSRMLTVVR